MRAWSVVAVICFAILTASCGGNGTIPTITVTPTPVNVLVNGSQLFIASIAGSSSSSVTFQICLPPPKSGDQPVNCGMNGLGTISQVAGTNTAVYVAPAQVPNPSTFDVVAFSNQSNLYFGLAQLTIGTGVSIQLAPPSATVEELQSITFAATVTGSSNTAVSWTLNGNSISGGNPQLGTLTPGANNTAVYTAPGSVPSASITVSATSVADPNQHADASVSIVAPSNPTVTALSPTIVPEGSAQQDVYVEGSGFVTNDTVYAGSGVARAPVTTFFISTTLLRATIPSNFFQQSAPLPLQVQRTASVVSQTENMTVVPVRPAIIASNPTSTGTNVSSLNVNLTGGFYVAGKTQAFFNGLPVTGSQPGTDSTRHLTVNIPENSLGTAGLYPIFVQNTDVPSGSPNLASTNLSVEPPPASIPTAQIATIPVGSTPAAVAIDQSLGLALVANSGDGSVSVIDLSTNTVARTITGVATTPTGIAVDDMLSPNVAVVVDNAKNTLVPINLSTFAVGAPVSLPVSAVSPTPPYSIGINPVTHRGLVANQLTSQLSIINISISNGSPSISLVPVTGPSWANYVTGQKPVVAIDPRLNWAVVAPGGGIPIIDVVDLGSPVTALYPSGQSPQLLFVQTLTGALSPQGVGINPETHVALLTESDASQAFEFSLLDGSITSVSFSPQSGAGYVAAGASLTSNLGIVANQNSNTASIVDLAGQSILQTNIAVGNFPQAVAVDAATNKALVVNQNDGTVSIVSLGPVRGLHITEASPTATVTSTSPLTLTLDGSGFVSGTSQVLLDDVALPGAQVAVVSPRQIVATIPASLLTAARRYSVTVENPGGTTSLESNELDLTVIQPVTVGSTAAAAPYGVAVDPNLDLAVVSNFGENSISFVDLNHGIQLAPSPEPVGANPEGVAVLPRSSLAIVADSGSNQAHVIDETGVASPVPVSLCGTLCSLPSGAGVNGDTGEAAVADFGGSSSGTSGPNLQFNYYYSFVTMSLTSPSSGTSGITLDLGPNDVAFDPNLNYAAFTTTVGQNSPQSGFVDIVNFASGSLVGRISGLTRPSGVVYDPLNQVFLVSDNGANNVDIIDPKNNAFTSTPVQTGIGPTALDYNYNTSTLITSNSVSNSLSLLDYLCPPTGVVAECTGPKVRRIIALPNSPQFSVALDPKLDLAVVVDQQDNRVLLVPLP